MANKPGETRQVPQYKRFSDLVKTQSWITPHREYRGWAISRVNANRAKAAELAPSLGNRVIRPSQAQYLGRFPTISERIDRRAAVVLDMISGRFHVRYPAVGYKTNTSDVIVTSPMDTLEQALTFMSMVPDAPVGGG